MVPNLTTFLLSKLRRMPESFGVVSSSNQALTARLSQLPGEIMNLIIANIGPVDRSSRACTRLLVPAQWREGLASGSFIPWLWDLDREACRRKDTEATRGSTEPWDWELLVRTLAQEKVFEVEASLADAPLGLQNRRRIWSTVEEIFEYREKELRKQEDEQERAMSLS